MESIREILERYLNDDDDMLDMYLSSKAVIDERVHEMLEEQARSTAAGDDEEGPTGENGAASVDWYAVHRFLLRCRRPVNPIRHSAVDRDRSVTTRFPSILTRRARSAGWVPRRPADPARPGTHGHTGAPLPGSVGGRAVREHAQQELDRERGGGGHRGRGGDAPGGLLYAGKQAVTIRLRQLSVSRWPSGLRVCRRGWLDERPRSQVDVMYNKLATLAEYIDDTEDFVNIKQDSQRNQLLVRRRWGMAMLFTASLRLSMHTLACSKGCGNITSQARHRPPRVARRSCKSSSPLRPSAWPSSRASAASSA